MVKFGKKVKIILFIGAIISLIGAFFAYSSFSKYQFSSSYQLSSIGNLKSTTDSGFVVINRSNTKLPLKYLKNINQMF